MTEAVLGGLIGGFLGSVLADVIADLVASWIEERSGRRRKHLLTALRIVHSP